MSAHCARPASVGEARQAGDVLGDLLALLDSGDERLADERDFTAVGGGVWAAGCFEHGRSFPRSRPRSHGATWRFGVRLAAPAPRELGTPRSGYVRGMPASAAILVGLLVVVLLVVVLSVPAGYGLPAPIFGLLALLFAGPALFVGFLLYRRLAKRGEIQTLSEQADERRDSDQRAVTAPNAGETAQRVSAFRRAEGKPPVEVGDGEVREAS